MPAILHLPCQVYRGRDIDYVAVRPLLPLHVFKAQFTLIMHLSVSQATEHCSSFRMWCCGSTTVSIAEPLPEVGAVGQIRRREMQRAVP